MKQNLKSLIKKMINEQKSQDNKAIVKKAILNEQTTFAENDSPLFALSSQKTKIISVMKSISNSAIKAKIISNCIFELMDILVNYSDKIDNTFYRRFMIAMSKIRKDIGAE